jgi:Membrane-bound metallopeptidase
MEEKLNFRLSRMNVIVLTVTLALILITITAFIIAFTPLREYIPGYTDVNLNRKVYELGRKTDSLNTELKQKDIYFQNIQRIIEGYDFADDSINAINIYSPLATTAIESITSERTPLDSALRADFEEETEYNIYSELDAAAQTNVTGVKNFFVPLTGVVTSRFDANNRHYGVDISAQNFQIINATLDGTVVHAAWSIENGYIIGIQHADNYFSTYKHNSSLLKKEGDFVKAGEAIAIIGESGELSTGPHLHFELWHNGTAINPEEYMNFETKKQQSKLR